MTGKALQKLVTRWAGGGNVELGKVDKGGFYGAMTPAVHTNDITSAAQKMQNQYALHYGKEGR